MPEAPDFESIARHLMGDPTQVEIRSQHDMRHAIVEQLRLVWNARGAADLVKLEAELWKVAGPLAAPYAKKLDALVRSLDR